MNISLENIEKFKVPLKEYISNWIFKDEHNQLASDTHQDQIFPLSKEASNFLWNYAMNLGLEVSEKYFKSITKFNSEFADQQAIKKYLFNLGIPFDQKVLIAQQPDTAFVLTWKMVIKYAHNMFFGDQVIRDKAHNWQLEFHHDGQFSFGKDLIYDGQREILNTKKKLKSSKENDTKYSN